MMTDETARLLLLEQEDEWQKKRQLFFSTCYDEKTSALLDFEKNSDMSGFLKMNTKCISLSVTYISRVGKHYLIIYFIRLNVKLFLFYSIYFQRCKMLKKK